MSTLDTDRIPSHALPASEWGDQPPLCITRCMRNAYLTVDGDPFCIECADTFLDRLQAIEIYPQLRETLPSVDGSRPKVARPPWRVGDWEASDMTKLNELRRQWDAFQQQVADADRCIALIPAGGRCVRRRMAGQRLCETHYAARYAA